MIKVPADTMDSSQNSNWNVYIIRCSDDSLYTGITTEPERRFRQHATGRGARFFRARQPVAIVYLEQGHTRSTASKREIQIKGMTKKDKAALLLYGSNALTGGQQ